jgi:hypothetical protein
LFVYQQQSIESGSSDSATLGSAAGTRLLAIVDRLVQEIEKVGLFTVGIYRRPGQVGKVKKLLYELNTSPGMWLGSYLRVLLICGN